MKFDEAEKIYRSWQEYVEIADKMSQIFASIPESFLPYPLDVLEEALNIIAKKYFDEGNKTMSESIQRFMAGTLGRVKKDELAIESIMEYLDLILKNPELRTAKLTNLKKCRDSWEKFRNDKKLV